MAARRTVRRLAGEADVAAAARDGARRLAERMRALGRRGAARRDRGLRGGAQRGQVRARRRGRAGAGRARRAGTACASPCATAGPGIADVEAALRDGVSSGGSLGLGLPGARRLMDDFALESSAGAGPSWRWRAGRAACSRPARPRDARCARARAASRSRSAFRNGLLLGLAAGPRAGTSRAPGARGLARAGRSSRSSRRDELDPGERARGRAGVRQRARRAARLAARGRGRLRAAAQRRRDRALPAVGAGAEPRGRRVAPRRHRSTRVATTCS